MKSLVCHQLFDNNSSNLTSIDFSNDFATNVVPTSEARDANLFYLTANATGEVLLFDLDKNQLSIEATLPENAYPGYAYYDPYKNVVWVSNDGDKESGCAAQCENGSSVIVLHNNQNGTLKGIELNRQICIGRGHHVAAFSKPSTDQPNIPEYAYVSNLLDGTISVFDNRLDGKFLELVKEINLVNTDKEKDSSSSKPNNAFPHGMVFSPITGRIYNLNNGYGTISIIDPISNEIVDNIDMKVSSNLLLHPNGRFIIGKGADRKENPNHVIGRLSVFDLQENQVSYRLDVDDFYPSTYRFHPDGSKLYVTTASTGKGAQKENLNVTDLYIYDCRNLPHLELIEKITLGRAHCGRRPMAFFQDAGHLKNIIIPNPTDGTLSILDGETHQLVKTVELGQTNAKEITFSFWNDRFFGS